MRVALLSPLHSNPGRTQGGIEVVIANLANAFAGWGLETDLLAYPPRDADGRPEEISDRVNVIDIGRRSKVGGGLAVARYLRERRPEGLLAAGHRCNVMAAIARRRSKVATRVVLSVHNTMSRRLASLGPIKRRLQNMTLCHLYGSADGMVAVSEGVKEDLIESFGFNSDRVRVIYNPLVSDAIGAKAAAHLDHPWFQNSAPSVILAVGRLRPQKDYSTLVRAFARLRRSRHCRLAILGEGPERTRIERLAEELGVDSDIYMPGIVSNPFPFMRTASLYVMSSAWEGLGNVLIEAMSVGTPIVATDCPSGPREILENGRYGTLVPVGDDAKLAEAMAAMLDRPTSPEELRQAAKRFDIETGARRYLDAMGVEEIPAGMRVPSAEKTAAPKEADDG